MVTGASYRRPPPRLQRKKVRKLRAQIESVATGMLMIYRASVGLVGKPVAQAEFTTATYIPRTRTNSAHIQCSSPLHVYFRPGRFLQPSVSQAAGRAVFGWQMNANVSAFVRFLSGHHNTLCC